MSQLVAKIMLAILMFPLASLWYLFVLLFLHRTSFRLYTRDDEWFGAGLATWIFVAVYWILLWRSSVRWTMERIGWSAFAALGSLLASVAITSFRGGIDREVMTFIGTALAPLLWLTTTCFIWRENRAERTERLRAVNEKTLVCPNCGYNLTGLSESRCPECGGKFTLNELVATQPKRAMTEVE